MTPVRDDMALGAAVGRPGRRADDGALRRARPSRRHQAGPDAGHRRRPLGRGARCAACCRSTGPTIAVLGEEFGGTATFTGRQWVIDPIDGTKNFVRGVPVWATLIALLHDGVPVAGVVERACAATSLVGRRRTRAPSRPSQAGQLGGWRCRRSPTSSRRACRFPVFRDGPSWACATASSNSPTASGGCAPMATSCSYCLLAEGAVDIAAEPEVSLWDLAALDIVVREAGGAFTDLSGRTGPHGGSVVATNGLLHEAVLNRLNGG